VTGKGVGRVVCGAVERDDPGSTPASGGRFLSTVNYCYDFDGVPLTLVSAHCWHVKENYHSARVQVMESGRSAQSQERKQYVCILQGCLSASLTVVRHSALRARFVTVWLGKAFIIQEIIEFPDLQ